MRMYESTCWVDLMQGSKDILVFRGMDIGTCKVKEGDSFLEIETEDERVAKEFIEGLEEEGWTLLLKGQSQEYEIGIEKFEELFSWFKEEYPYGFRMRYNFGEGERPYIIRMKNMQAGLMLGRAWEEESFVGWDAIEKVKILRHSSSYEKKDGFKIERDGRKVRLTGLNPMTCDMGILLKVKGEDEEIECADYIIDEMWKLKELLGGIPGENQSI